LHGLHLAPGPDGASTMSPSSESPLLRLCDFCRVGWLAPIKIAPFKTIRDSSEQNHGNMESPRWPRTTSSWLKTYMWLSLTGKSIEKGLMQGPLQTLHRSKVSMFAGQGDDQQVL